MKRLLLAPILMLALAAPAQAIPGSALLNARPAAHLTAHHRQQYWHMGVENCTISTAYLHYPPNTLRGTPYITCTPQTGGWQSTPQQIGNAPGDINPADAVNPTASAETYNPFAMGAS